ncbi:MAG: hypothetical protein K6C69_03525 [Lachnospiraceae bacterium]|nr:hypothetical protein [Lachnospiraceae bacterium]
MTRNNVLKLILFLGWIIFIVNCLLIIVIMYEEGGAIIDIYKIILAGIIIVNSVIILLISVLMKKKLIIINILTISVIVMVAMLGKSSVSSEEIWDYRNKIVQEIENGNFEVTDGVINLPNEEIYEKVSDSKQVILAMDGDQTVIYFYRFAGMLEDSCGYIYYSNKIDRNICMDTIDFVNIKHLDGNWYSCSTQ